MVRFVKIAGFLMNKNYDTGFYELINLWFNGEKWVLSDYSNQSLEDVIKDEGLDLEDEGDRDVIEDYVRDYLSEELTDMSLKEYNSYYSEEAPIERLWITYFDEYGVEHQVRVNTEQGKSMRYPWGNWE